MQGATNLVKKRCEDWDMGLDCKSKEAWVRKELPPVRWSEGELALKERGSA